MQKTIDFFREETAKAKSESHLAKLELEKQKRMATEFSNDLNDL